MNIEIYSLKSTSKHRKFVLFFTHLIDKKKMFPDQPTRITECLFLEHTRAKQSDFKQVSNRFQNLLGT